MTLVKNEASIKLLTTAPVYELLQYTLTISTCPKKKKKQINKNRSHFYCQGRYTLGDKLQQHVAATDHSMCTGQATSCSNKVRRHVAAKNRFVCAGEFLWKISLSPQQNFVASKSRKKSNQPESLRLVAATKFCCSKRFSQNSPVHTKRFVAATCLHDMLLQLIA